MLVKVVEGGIDNEGDILKCEPSTLATGILYQILSSDGSICKKLLQEDQLDISFPNGRQESLRPALFRGLVQNFFSQQHGTIITHKLGDTSVSTYGVPKNVEYCDGEWCLVLLDIGTLSIIRIPFSDIEGW